MNFNAITNESPEERAAFIDWLSKTTAEALTKAQGNPKALQAAIQEYYSKARSSHFSIDEIEDILGVNEPSILDLVDLNEDDEDIVITKFESFAHEQAK